MNQALQKELLAETYEDVQKSIAITVRRVMRRYEGFDFEELLAEANLHYIRAFKAYDEEQSQFNTWLTAYIYKALLGYIRDECRQIHPSLNDENVNTDSLQVLSFSVIELLDELGQDACTALHLFLDTPKEIIDIALSNGKAHRHLVAGLKNHLFGMGWTMHRIIKSFEEIQNVLQN